MKTQENKKRGMHWMIRMLLPLMIMVFSGIFLYAGYFKTDVSEMPLLNKIIWWILFGYGLFRIIVILVKRK